jgi:hypothetical protein
VNTRPPPLGAIFDEIAEHFVEILTLNPDLAW